MSSQSPAVSNKAAISTSKPSNPAQVSPAASQAQQSFSDTSARRSGSAARSSPAARNIQSTKPKHKQGKRFRALDEDAEAEVFSMQNPHGRRGQQSITHLMQFALPPRPSAQQQYHRHQGGARNRTRANPTWGLGSGYHSVDKARYIHANYRFIVDPCGNYRAQSEDADIHLDWNNVLQVIASSKTQTASCPICLGEPTAPRMAKCGHIFCLPCLIRYMHSEDASAPPPEKRARWKKCPICYDSIYVSETRPVRWFAGAESDPPLEGSDIVLRLVRRKPGSTLAMPRESAETLGVGEDVPWYFAAEVMDHVRVMRGSEDYMLQQYDESIVAIEQQQREDELMFGEDDEWTGKAMRLLREAKEKVKGIGNPPEQPKKPETASALEPSDRPLIEFINDESAPDMFLQSNGLSTPNTTTDTDATDVPQTHESILEHRDSSVPRTLTEMRQRHTEKPQPSEYLFYQGLLHYYLSPLDIRILKSAFGSYHAFPSSILPRVERVSSGHIVDDDLRKRIKYLAHLPSGCEVAFLECDWRDVVRAEVLEEFRPMLERRRKRNEEKDAREEKERVRIEKAEERELASIRARRRPSIPDADAFFTASLPASPPVQHTSTSPPWTSGAQRPGFSSLASPSTSPNLHRTVWGTAAVTPASPDLNASLPRDDQLAREDDGWLQGWERDLLLEEQLVAGTEALSLAPAEASSGAKPVNGGGKKGKKGKKITLMSTGGARRGA